MSANNSLPGIHHVTAIAGDPQENIDFYMGLLGLRLVKRTVNFDDPGSYHLYYGDGLGRPGTIMTFFAWPGAPRGRVGAGQVGVTAFSIPADSLDYWRERLAARGVTTDAPVARFDDRALSFADPDGMPLELIASARPDERTGWAGGPTPAEYAIRGFHAPTLYVRQGEPSERLLTGVMGFRRIGQDGERVRFAAGEGGTGAGHSGRSGRPSRRCRRAAGGGHGPPHRLAHAGRRTTTGLATYAGRARYPGDGGARPPVFPLHLLPRAGRHPLRDRHRRTGLRRGRGARAPGHGAQAAALVGGTAPSDRAGAAADPPSTG